MQTRWGQEKGTTLHSLQNFLIRFKWGAQWRVWGSGPVLTAPTSCPFTLALPTAAPHLAGPPRVWRLVWGEARGGQALEGATRAGGSEEHRAGREGREGVGVETGATPSPETEGDRD